MADDVLVKLVGLEGGFTLNLHLARRDEGEEKALAPAMRAIATHCLF